LKPTTHVLVVVVVVVVAVVFVVVVVGGGGVVWCGVGVRGLNIICYRHHHRICC
jgi:hypothetical protein